MEDDTDNGTPAPTNTISNQGIGDTYIGGVTPSPAAKLSDNRFYDLSSEKEPASTLSSIATNSIVFGVDKDYIMPNPTKSFVDLIDEDLVLFLDRILPDVDMMSETTDEMYEGLVSQQIKSWIGFTIMGNEIIDDMRRPHRHNPIPLTSNSIQSLRLIKQWMDERSDNGDPAADDIESYTGADFIAYVRSVNRLKRNGIQQTMNVSGTPVSKAPFSQKSIGEKRYEAWNRTIGKRTKSSFETLKTDDQYRIWKPIFDAEIAHQKLTHVMDPTYDPTLLTCTFEQELWKEQMACLWTIMLSVFKNPLGRSCVTWYMETKDPRALFFEHHQLQEESPAKSFNTSIHLSTLNKLSIKEFQGSRVDFIATWFEQLRQLNELSNDSLSYTMTKGLLLKAIQGDPKLPDVFTTLVDTNDKDVDIETLRTTLLHQASLYDGKDKYLKTGNIKANYSDMAHTESTDLSLDVHRATRSPPNPEARLSDNIFGLLDPTDKNAWRQLPE